MNKGRLKGIVKRVIEHMGYTVRKSNSWSGTSSSQVLKELEIPNSPDTIFFDVGAHWGETASQWRQIFDKVAIYSFEPYRPSYLALKEIRLSNFYAFNVGFSDKDYSDMLFVNRGSPTNSLLELSASAKTVWGGNVGLEASQEVICEFRTLDSFVAERGIDEISFLKLDTQGAEFKVLKGSESILRRKMIKFIQLEIILGATYEGQKSIGFYFSYLEGLGYRFLHLSDCVYVGSSLVQLELFFSSD